MFDVRVLAMLEHGLRDTYVGWIRSCRTHFSRLENLKMKRPILVLFALVFVTIGVVFADSWLNITFTNDVANANTLTVSPAGGTETIPATATVKVCDAGGTPLPENQQPEIRVTPSKGTVVPVTGGVPKTTLLSSSITRFRSVTKSESVRLQHPIRPDRRVCLPNNISFDPENESAA